MKPPKSSKFKHYAPPTKSKIGIAMENLFQLQKRRKQYGSSSFKEAACYAIKQLPSKKVEEIISFILEN